MTDRALRLAIAGTACAGAAVATYLTWARLSHAQLVCTSGGCEAVQRSEYAEVLGVPVAVLGLVAYLVILGTALRTAEVARVLGAAVALGGFAFSAYLLYAQLVLIDAVCVWCVASDALMSVLAALTLLRLAPATRRPLAAGTRG